MDSNWNWKHIYLVDLFVFYPLFPVAPVEHVADATSRCLNTEVKMICRKKLDFMSHIANCQLPKNMETKHLNLTFSMLEICFSLQSKFAFRRNRTSRYSAVFCSF